MYHPIHHKLFVIDKICTYFNIPQCITSLSKLILIKSYNNFHYSTSIILALKIKESFVLPRDIINYINKIYKEDIQLSQIIKEEIALVKYFNYELNIDSIEYIYNKIIEIIKDKMDNKDCGRIVKDTKNQIDNEDCDKIIKDNKNQMNTKNQIDNKNYDKIIKDKIDNKNYDRIKNNIKHLYDEKLIDIKYSIEDIALCLLREDEIKILEIYNKFKVDRNKLEEIKKELDIENKIFKKE